LKERIPEKLKRKDELIAQTIKLAREYSDRAILFHQTVAEILGINASDMRCLDAIMLSGYSSPGQLAEYTGLSTGATTAMIDRLEKGNFIERHPHPKDRRGTILTLTQEASLRLQALFSSPAGALNQLISGYSGKDLKLISDFFTKAGALWNREREKLTASPAAV
jgi:DNA-binding MarR family transcriptional regulator